MKKWLWLLGFAILTHLVWTIAAFLGYSVAGADDKPNLLGSLIAVCIILPLTFSLGSFYRRLRFSEALLYAAFSTVATFGLNLLISIPNGTTQSFFGNWFVYLSFIAVFAGGFFGASRKSEAVVL